MKQAATSQNLEELEKASYELLSLLDTEKDIDLIAHVKLRVDFWSETIASNMEQNEVSFVSGGTPGVPYFFRFSHFYHLSFYPDPRLNHTQNAIRVLKI